MSSFLSNTVNERRVWYMLLQFGVPLDYNNSHLAIVRRECQPLGIKIRKIYVASGRSMDNGRYLFRFLRYKRNDMAAMRFAESFMYAFSFVYGPMIRSDNDPIILRIPDDIISSREKISLNELVKLEESRDYQDRTIDFPYMTIGSFSNTTKEIYEKAWHIASVIYRENKIFEATRFLKGSYDNFYVLSVDIPEVIYETDSTPFSSSQQTNFENALQNAFKAVEAVIGDPPTDNRKLFIKMKEIGLNPYEEIGYINKQPFYQVIRDMNRERDNKSAHGSTHNRTITAKDLLNYQTCARYVVLASIESVIGNHIFQ